MIHYAYYLAGPMQGYPEYNHPAFHTAAAQLRMLGYQIINPAEYGNLTTGWRECMKRDMHALLWCEAVIVLPGWEQSKGATLECNLAADLEMQVFELHSMLADHQGHRPEELSRDSLKRAYRAIHQNNLPATEAVGIWPDRIGQQS